MERLVQGQRVKIGASLKVLILKRILNRYYRNFWGVDKCIIFDNKLHVSSSLKPKISN